MEHDRLADAKARGAEIQSQLIEEAGGAWTLDEVSRHLGISVAAVQQRLARGGLLAVQIGDAAVFPRCQFARSGTPLGLREVLRAIDSRNHWVRLSVLLSPTLRRSVDVSPDDDEELTVIEALKRGRRDEALHAAHSWGRQRG